MVWKEIRQGQHFIHSLDLILIFRASDKIKIWNYPRNQNTCLWILKSIKWQSSSSITYIFIMLIELDMQVIISLDEQNK